MRTVGLGLLVVAVVLCIGSGEGASTAGQEPRVAGPPERSAMGSNELVAFRLGANERGEQIAILDPRQKVLGVYGVDPASGEIELRCVRNLTWDLQMTEFNGKAPTPGEIRSLLEQK